MKITLAALATLALGVPAVLAGGLGWIAAPEPWEIATGWRDIPADERPDESWRRPDVADAPPTIAWLGHAGFLLEWEGQRVLLDPNMSRWVTITRRIIEQPRGVEALGRIDAALISHAHFDHLDLATLAAVPRLGVIVVPAGSEDYVAAFPRVAGARIDVPIRVGTLDVVAVPAAHNGSRYHPFASERRAVGWIIRRGGDAVYFAGDTGAANDFEAIAARYRPALAILPIGGFSPPFLLGRYPLPPEQAVTAAERLGRPLVIPAHFGTFVVSLDRPSDALPRFARAARAHGIHWTMPRLFGAASRGHEGERT